MTTGAPATPPAAAGAPPVTARPAPDPAVLADQAAITPSWLDVVLGTAGTPGGVRSVDAVRVGTGQMAVTVRLFVRHADGTQRSLVAKLARQDSADGLARMAYAKEVAFYQEMAHRLAIRTPACHYAAIAEDAPAFVLVLEDMVDAAPGDQIAGCSLEQARAAVVNLAGLHGPTWCDPAIEEASWLGVDGGIDVGLLQPFVAGAAEAFGARFADDLEPDEVEVLDAARERLAAWALAPADRFAVIHGDYRLDNLLFPEGDPDGVAAVDWQTASVGLPARDLAFFLATSLDVEARRRHGDKLLRAYHAALTRHGVSGYPITQCREDYRAGLMHAPLIILLGRATAAETERGDAMFLAMWRRAAAAIHDAGTLAVL